MNRLLLSLAVLLFTASSALAQTKPPASAPAPAAKVAKGTVTIAAPADVKVTAKKEPAPASAPAPAAAAPAATPAPAPAAATPAPAPAQPAAPAQQTLLQLVLQNLLQLGFFVVSIMISILISVLAKKYKFEGVASKVQDIVTKAIGFAEQKAKSAAKLNPTAPPTTSAEKMKSAIEFATALAQQYKLPELAESKWESLLESALGVAKTTTNGAK